MKTEEIILEKQHGSLTSYTIGFILSLILTFVAYAAVVMHLLSTQYLIYLISLLALLQLMVQLVFFLHLFEEQKPRWNLVFFISTVGILLIVIVGSIWIMNHLNYNMSPMKMDQFLIKDEGIKK